MAERTVSFDTPTAVWPAFGLIPVECYLANRRNAAKCLKLTRWCAGYPPAAMAPDRQPCPLTASGADRLPGAVRIFPAALRLPPNWPSMPPTTGLRNGVRRIHPCPTAEAAVTPKRRHRVVAPRRSPSFRVSPFYLADWSKPQRQASPPQVARMRLDSPALRKQYGMDLKMRIVGQCLTAAWRIR